MLGFSARSDSRWATSLTTIALLHCRPSPAPALLLRGGSRFLGGPITRAMCGGYLWGGRGGGGEGREEGGYILSSFWRSPWRSPRLLTLLHVPPLYPEPSIPALHIARRPVRPHPLREEGGGTAPKGEGTAGCALGRVRACTRSPTLALHDAWQGSAAVAAASPAAGAARRAAVPLAAYVSLLGGGAVDREPCVSQ